MTNVENLRPVDPLAERFRAAFDKTSRAHKRSEAARAEWIDGTIELAAVISDSRKQYPDHMAFSRWLERNGLKPMNKNDRSALLGMGEDLVAARELLTTTTYNGFSWDWIWRKRPNRTFPKPRKGVTSRGARPSGHRQRQRARRIPDVMQDKPRPLDAIHIKGLTREEVDPDFKGNAIEFAAKYGPVTLHTKAEIEHNKHQDVLQKWLGIVANAARSAEAVSGLPDPATMIDWLAKPGKRARYDGWIYTLETTVDRLKACLPPKTLDEIEAEGDAIGKPLQ